MENNKELEKIAQEYPVEPSQSQRVQKSFQEFLEQAEEWKEKAMSINITSPTQTKEMAEARQIRLALKKIRTGTENTRKDLKEDYLKVGKLIDSVANFVKGKIEPLEDHLERQEKFLENLQKEENDKILQDRVSRLTPYVEDISLYNIAEMTNEKFDALVAQAKKIKQDADVEVEREARESQEKAKAEKEQAEKDRLENERLKAEAEKREKEIAAERQKTKEEAEKREAAFKKEIEEKRIDAEKQKKLVEQNEAKEREEKEALAKQLWEKEEADRKTKEAKEKAEHDARVAPDKDKLFAYAESIRAIKPPVELTKAAQEIIKVAEKELLAVSQKVKDNIKNI